MVYLKKDETDIECLHFMSDGRERAYEYAGHI